MTNYSKYHQRDGSQYRKAKEALEAAHKACFNHPDRGPVGMSHGPFSGVNVALGIIADQECNLGRLTAAAKGAAIIADKSGQIIKEHEATITTLTARVAELEEALDECETYFDNRADAEYFTDSPIPVGNEEMGLLVTVRKALKGGDA